VVWIDSDSAKTKILDHGLLLKSNRLTKMEILPKIGEISTMSKNPVSKMYHMAMPEAGAKTTARVCIGVCSI
jgi:hypothetical protein